MGHTAEEVRAYQHDLAGMLKQCEDDGLRISKNTRRFIEASATEGNYVRVRYDTGLDYRGGDWPPPPRANASLTHLTNAVADVCASVSDRFKAMAAKHGHSVTAADDQEQ
jgi:hypothetical protein